MCIRDSAKTGLDAMKGIKATVFIDKLGERLAFERTGTRLYGALIGKCDASPALPGGPTSADLQAIQAEELAHFELVREVIVSLGGDPTAVTPSADVVSVMSSGLLQIITDARTSLKQSLEAILVAELADNDGWMMLIHLAQSSGHEQIAARFEEARMTEERHLTHVRQWIMAATDAAAMPAKAAGRA